MSEYKFVYKWGDPNLKMLLAGRSVQDIDHIIATYDHTKSLELFAFSNEKLGEIVPVGRIEP